MECQGVWVGPKVIQLIYLGDMPKYSFLSMAAPAQLHTAAYWSCLRPCSLSPFTVPLLVARFLLPADASQFFLFAQKMFCRLYPLLLRFRHLDTPLGKSPRAPLQKKKKKKKKSHANNCVLHIDYTYISTQ